MARFRQLLTCLESNIPEPAILSSALAMDKGMAKQLFIAGGIPTPQGISMKKENRKDSVKELGLKLPCVVKPCCGGSSIGVTIVRTEDEFKSAFG